jgi:hypothetical protein
MKLRSKLFRSLTIFAAAAVASAISLAPVTPRVAFAQAAAKPEHVLKAAEITNNLWPDKVFFRGQSATTQLRNTGGVEYADGMFVLAGLVDTSGYTVGIREKYQAYLITEVAIEIGGQKLAPGAYGIGWIAGNKFNVMDLGAHDLFTIDSKHDADIKRPAPLQVIAGPTAGTYLIYNGRDSVQFQRAN